MTYEQRLFWIIPGGAIVVGLVISGVAAPVSGPTLGLALLAGAAVLIGIGVLAS